MWSAGQITFEVVVDETDDPVVTFTVVTPAGTLKAMAEPEWVGRRLVLRGFHIHGEDVGPQEFGWRQLRWVADAALKELDLDELVIEGEIRTSGAGPGHRPRPLRFNRALRP
jgi:hypothetical protein